MKLKKLNARGFSHDIILVLFVAIFAIAGVAYLVASHAATPSGSTLSAGQSLLPGQSLVSPNGQYRAVMQGDGNFVVYNPSTYIWYSGTAGISPGSLNMQADGNLVVYNANSQAVWDSGTAGTAGRILSMQDDGNLVIYTSSWSPIWSTKGGLISSAPQPSGGPVQQPPSTSGPSTTVQIGRIAGHQCSVTAYTPFDNSIGNTQWDGGISCQGGGETSSLKLCLQVQNGANWYNVSGMCLTSKNYTGNPNRIGVYSINVAVSGHVYRTEANETIQYTNSGATTYQAGYVADSPSFTQP